MLFWHLLLIYLIYNLGLFGFLLFILCLFNYYYYCYLDTIIENAYVNEDINIPDQDMDSDTYIDDLFYIAYVKTNKLTIAAYYYTNKYIELKFKPVNDLLEKYYIIKTYNYLDKYYTKPYIIVKNRIIIWYISKSLKANLDKMKIN